MLKLIPTYLFMAAKLVYERTMMIQGNVTLLELVYRIVRKGQKDTRKLKLNRAALLKGTPARLTTGATDKYVRKTTNLAGLNIFFEERRRKSSGGVSFLHIASILIQYKEGILYYYMLAYTMYDSIK